MSTVEPFVFNKNTPKLCHILQRSLPKSFIMQKILKHKSKLHRGAQGIQTNMQNSICAWFQSQISGIDAASSPVLDLSIYSVLVFSTNQLKEWFAGYFLKVICWGLIPSVLQSFLRKAHLKGVEKFYKNQYKAKLLRAYLLAPFWHFLITMLHIPTTDAHPGHMLNNTLLCFHTTPALWGVHVHPSLSWASHWSSTQAGMKMLWPCSRSQWCPGSLGRTALVKESPPALLQWVISP